jgi:hypothetical protein
VTALSRLMNDEGLVPSSSITVTSRN